MKYIQHYLFMRLSAMPAEDFFALFKEVLEEKQSGKEKIQRMVNDIVRELEEDDEGYETRDDDVTAILVLKWSTIVVHVLLLEIIHCGPVPIQDRYKDR